LFARKKGICEQPVIIARERSDFRNAFRAHRWVRLEDNLITIVTALIEWQEVIPATTRNVAEVLSLHASKEREPTASEEVQSMIKNL